MSMLFGGLGIFLLYHSISNPILSAYALISSGAPRRSFGPCAFTRPAGANVRASADAAAFMIAVGVLGILAVLGWR
jgi:hypothetical protein